MSNFLRLHGLQHARLPCTSLSPRVCSNSCPLSQWWYLTISSSAAIFSFCLQSFPASGSFPMIRLFALSSQSIGASASLSVLPMNIQDWFPFRLTDFISLMSKRLSRVFSSTTNLRLSMISKQFQQLRVVGRRMPLNSYAPLWPSPLLQSTHLLAIPWKLSLVCMAQIQM